MNKFNLTAWLTKLKVGTRLGLGLGLVVLVVAAGLAIGHYRTLAVQGQVEQVFQDNVEKVKDLATMTDSVHTSMRALRKAVLFEGTKPTLAADTRETIAAARKAYDKEFATLVAGGILAANRPLVARFDTSKTQTRELIDRTLQLASSGRYEAAKQLLSSEVALAARMWLDGLDAYSKVQHFETVATGRAVTAQFTERTRTNIAATIVALLLALGIAYLVSRSVTQPLKRLQEAIHQVREGGGLDALADVESEDELGDMAFSVNSLLQEQVSSREAADASRRRAEAENERLNDSVIAILEAVNQLSQRDLTVRAPVTEDVIGTVSDSINQLSDETAAVLRIVTLAAGQVADVSGNVRTQAQLVSETAADERQRVQQMVESLIGASQQMDQVAELAVQSNNHAAQATEVTNTALATVNSAVIGMDSIRETISETEKRIKRLGERSQEITGIVNLINTISERTHVLALNASMQAAVAGEAGRGFAVVAEEVQRLAESSRDATQQISTLVENIQLETNETITTVNRTINEVVEGSELARQAGEQMRLTQQITGQLVEHVQRITASSQQQREMSAQLLQSVQTIGESTDRTAAQIESQNQQTESLIQEANRLVESVSVFKLPAPA